METLRYQPENNQAKETTRVNQALAAYIKSVVPNLRADSYSLPKNSYLKSVEFFTTKEFQPFPIPAPLYDTGSFEVFYRKDMPESLLGYIDKNGKESIGGSRTSSTFTFSPKGEAWFEHWTFFDEWTLPGEVRPLRSWQETLADESLRERVTFVSWRPEEATVITNILSKNGAVLATNYSYPWYNNYHDRSTLGWYEFIVFVLTQLNKRYPRRFPSFLKFEEDFYKTRDEQNI